MRLTPAGSKRTGGPRGRSFERESDRLELALWPEAGAICSGARRRARCRKRKRDDAERTKLARSRAIDRAHYLSLASRRWRAATLCLNGALHCTATQDLPRAPPLACGAGKEQPRKWSGTIGAKWQCASGELLRASSSGAPRRLDEIRQARICALPLLARRLASCNHRVIFDRPPANKRVQWHIKDQK